MKIEDLRTEYTIIFHPWYIVHELYIVLNFRTNTLITGMYNNMIYYWYILLFFPLQDLLEFLKLLRFVIPAVLDFLHSEIPHQIFIRLKHERKNQIRERDQKMVYYFCPIHLHCQQKKLTMWNNNNAINFTSMNYLRK